MLMNIKKSFLLIFIYISLFSAHAEGEKQLLSFSLMPQAAFSYGFLEETLYTDELGKVSELKWDKNLFMYGGCAQFSYSCFSGDFSFFSSVPCHFGKMTDSDWLNEKDRNMKTTYSVGDNHAERNFDISAAFSFDFRAKQKPEQPVFVFSPSIEIQYSYDFFKRPSATGWYGHSEYSSDKEHHWWYEEEAKKFPYTYWNEEQGRYVTQKLAGVSYKRHSFNSWIGIKASVIEMKRMGLQFSFFISPVVYINSIDIHHGSETEYKQIQYGFFSRYKSSFSISYKISNTFSILSEFSVMSSRLLKGSYYKNDIFDSNYQTGAGETQIKWSFGTAVHII